MKKNVMMMIKNEYKKLRGEEKEDTEWKDKEQKKWKKIK